MALVASNMAAATEGAGGCQLEKSSTDRQDIVAQLHHHSAPPPPPPPSPSPPTAASSPHLISSLHLDVFVPPGTGAHCGVMKTQALSRRIPGFDPSRRE